MATKIIIGGNTPAQKNNKQILINQRTGKPFIASNQRVKVWQAAAFWQLKHLGKLSATWVYPVSATMVFYFSDQRKRDLENCASSVQDVLVRANIITDDSYQYLCPVTLDFGGIDKQAPRAEIWLEET